MSKHQNSIPSRLKSLFTPFTSSKVEVVVLAFRLDILAIRFVRVDTGETPKAEKDSVLKSFVAEKDNNSVEGFPTVEVTTR
jgi:hypothetical protein